MSVIRYRVLTRRVVGILVASALLAVPFLASADHGGSGHINMSLTVQATGTNSVYVAWSHSGYGSYTYYLQESVNDGDYITISAGKSKSATFTNKPNGSYKFRVIYESCYFGSCNSQWTRPVSIGVGPLGTVDSLADQFHYTYEARADGAQQIFLRRTSETDPGDGAIDVLLLQPSSSGTFLASVPTAAQISKASKWAIANVDLSLSDVNVDGFVDVALSNVGRVIPGAADQIIFAPAQPYVQLPKGIRQIDSHLAEFATDLMSYVRDPEYFENAAVEVEGGFYIYEEDCSWFWWGQSFEFECTVTPEWIEIGPYETFPGINSSAAAVWEKLKEVFTGSGTMQDVKDLIGSVIGVTIGGGTFCIDYGVDDADPDCPYIELNYLIAALANDAGVAGTPNTRAPNVIYLTRHRVSGTAYHLAIEFTHPTSGLTETISAAPDRPIPVLDLLKSDLNRWQDELNDLAGTITSVFVAETNSVYFNRLKLADVIYNDCIPYTPIPIGSSTPELGYNSNGYVAGILSSTGGIPTDSMSNYVGGSAAVPSNYFTVPNMPCP